MKEQMIRFTLLDGGIQYILEIRDQGDCVLVVQKDGGTAIGPCLRVRGTADTPLPDQ